MVNETSRERFETALAAHGLVGGIVDLPASARTAREAASAVGCTVAEIAKSLVFRTVERGDPVLAIMSGVNRASPGRIEAAIGAAVGMADADFVRTSTGYAIGGVPPFGHVHAIPTLLDEALLAFDAIWAAAGSPFSVFRISPQMLGRVTGGRWLPLEE